MAQPETPSHSLQSHPLQKTTPTAKGGPVGLCLTLFMLSYTIGVVPPMMPPMVQELDSSIGFVQSALVLMSLITASFTPTAENLNRRLGRKRLFGGALAVFAMGLGVMALSPNMGMFTLGLAGLTGLAGTILVTTPVALMDALHEHEQGKKYALLALTLAGIIGALVGALTGGFMAYELSWRWAFAVELVLIPIIGVLVRRIPVPTSTAPFPIDWVGGVLSLAGFSLTLVGLSLATELGWWRPSGSPQNLSFLMAPFGISVVPVLLATGLICLGLLIFWERQRSRQGHPSLLRLGVFNRRMYTIGLIIGTLHTMVNVGVQFNLFQFIPAVVGLNPLQTAIAVTPFTITQLVVLIGLAKRRPQLPHRLILQLGLGIKSIGIILLFTAISPTLTSWSLMPSLVVMGIGTGLFATYITSLTFAYIGENEKTEARGVYRPFQNLGASLGRGVLGTLLISLASLKIVDGIIAELGQAIDPEVRRQAIRSLQVAIQTLRGSERSAIFDSLPDRIQPVLNTILQTAAISAMRETLLVIFLLCLCCLGLSFLLPKTAQKLEAPIE